MYGADIEREYILIDITKEYPEFNNPKDRQKIRKLYHKFKRELRQEEI